MNRLDKDMAALRKLGLEAAPISASPHATDAELARIRADGEAGDLDLAYRHVSSCAACRARLLESVLPERVAAAVRLASETSLDAGRALDATVARAPALVITLASRRRLLLVLAAAAVVLLIGEGALRNRDAGPVAIEQRSYAGMMGREDAGPVAVAPEDADIELSLPRTAKDGAALVVVDGTGNPLAPARWFTRGEGGGLVVVVAPRTFAAHVGPPFGLVVVGEVARVREGIAAVAGRPMGSLEAAEAAIRARSGDARVQRIVIGETTPRK